ncbi:hypothetical protein ACFYO1_01900 [Nocardia sp. NPDC006044]|uniref:hypothetical protein n=1 Tax=Nocardia sp. NPDC006044 TaxID=3364306 RepID=UPI0036890810
MGNHFSADAVGLDIYMTNGSTDVFCDVIALAGSAAAGTGWQQNLVLHFCDLARNARGFGGFDMAELPWTRNYNHEQKFFIDLLDRANRRTGWDQLHYNPSIDHHLAAFTRMLTEFRPSQTIDSRFGDWTVAPNRYHLERCSRHGVYQGEFECRLCDPELQPSDAPTVWQLTSTLTENGVIADREIRQIPDELVTRVHAIVGTQGQGSTGILIERHHLEQISSLVEHPLDLRARHRLGKAIA